MKNAVNSRIPTILFVLGSILLGLLILYLPITNRLNKSLMENWQLSAQAKAFSLALAMQNGVEGGSSISSRSAIRDSICDYTQGLMTWKELQEFTAPKYNDGVAVLDNVVFAFRIVDEQILVQYITFGEEDLYAEFKNLALPWDENRVLFFDGRPYFLVVSDINKEGNCLGKDILLFNLSPVIDVLSSEGFSIKVISAGYGALNSEPSLGIQSMPPAKDQVTYTGPLLDIDAVVQISTSQNNILQATRQDTNLYLFLYILSLIILYALSNWIFVRKTSAVINEIEVSKQDFMQRAYKDALTDAYSRQFFSDWVNRRKEESDEANQSHIFVMIDIDQMKSINDTYGHEVGDEVLKSVVEVASKLIRHDDLIIRLGGDEFLIVFTGIDEHRVANIMQRIEAEIKKVDIWSIDICISYGIARLNPDEEIDEAIKEADQNMYLIKKEKFPLKENPQPRKRKK